MYLARMNFAKILRELERAGKPSPAEIRKAAAILKRAGFRVEEPVRWNGGRITAPPQPSAFTRRKPTPGQLTELPLPGWAEHIESQAGPDDDLLSGAMEEVESSNVHSIGFQIANPGDRTGTLLVRYLGQHQGGVRAGLGSLYAYRDVPVSLFRDFQHASSKGGWVWDHLRVRGTVAGHKFDYELIGVAGQYVPSLGRHVANYVPRAASLRQATPGQHYIPRNFNVGEIRGGRMQNVRVRSQLSPAVASMRGPPLDRGPGSDALRFQGGSVNRQGGR